jgi:hypothetical protein
MAKILEALADATGDTFAATFKSKSGQLVEICVRAAATVLEKNHAGAAAIAELAAQPLADLGKYATQELLFEGIKETIQGGMMHAFTMAGLLKASEGEGKEPDGDDGAAAPEGE